METMEEITQRLDRIEAALAMPPREYLNIDAAAEFIGVSRQTMDNWRMKATGGPAFCRIGRRVMYSVSDLRAFMEQCKQEPLS